MMVDLLMDMFKSIQLQILKKTATDSRVPTTSETATDPRPILRTSESTDIGLMIGIVIIIMVMIVSIVSVMVIIAVLFKKCRGKFTITAVKCSYNI